MPLIKSSSPAAVSRNIRQLRSDRYPQKQAVAIALSIARRNRKKSDGGAVDPFTGVDEPSEGAQRKFGRVTDAILSGARKTIEKPGRAMREGLTTEDAVNWAAPMALGMMGTGSPFSQAGTAGIFGGKLAGGADKTALARAEQMAAKGASRDAIWNETGWFKGADEKWRFEIPDDSLSVRKGYGAGIEYGGGDAWGRFEPKIAHEDLTAAYPGKFDYLAHDVKIQRGAEPQGRFMPEGAGRNEEFYYSDKPVLPSLFVEAPTTKQARSIASHELQHAVQDIEGFGSGASPDMYRSAAKQSVSDESKLWPAMYDMYRRSLGEVEARNVQARLNMTPEERRATPPWRTQDVPDAEQIIPPRHSIWSEAGMRYGGAITRARKLAAGGAAPAPPFYARSAARSLERAGMIHSPVAGRTDMLPSNVRSGAYVVPADTVSGIGQGNSMAGANALNKLFSMGPFGSALPKVRAPGGMKMPTGGMMKGRRGFADGGAPEDVAGQPTDVVLAGGEFVVPPDKVAEIGGGDLNRGHDILDGMVSHIRKTTIKTLRKLPKPKKS